MHWRIASGVLIAVMGNILLASSARTLTVEKTDDGGVVRVETDFYIAEVSPEFGGRIRGLQIKPSGDQLVYWDEKEFLGGLLDDKASTAEPNRVESLEHDERSCRVVMLKVGDLITRKTLT